MKRTFLVLSLPLFLAGCAQIFDANLFSSLDKLPPLDSGKLANASVVDIQQLAKDPTFYTQLKDDPVALTNTQDALNKVADDTNASDPDRITAAATLVTVTTNGSGVADLATSAIDNASTIKDTLAATTTAGQPEPNRFVNAIKIFLAGKTEPEIKITLDNLIVMASALKNMQTLSTIPALLPLAGTIDSNTFFTGSTDQGAFAQSAMMADWANANHRRRRNDNSRGGHSLPDQPGLCVNRRTGCLHQGVRGHRPHHGSGRRHPVQAHYLFLCLCRHDQGQTSLLR